MFTGRALVAALAGLAMICGAAWGQGTGCYEPAAEIRMSSDGAGGDAGSLFHGVAAKDGFVYVVSQADVLLVFNLDSVTDAESFVQIDQAILEIPLPHGTRSGLLRDGDRLYVYGWGGGQIFDISEPAAPVAVGTFRDSDERIFHLAKSGPYLVAACHERIVAYSTAMMPNHPMVVFSLPMESRVQAHTVAIVEDGLWVSGSKLRSSGATEYWLGVWDVTDFTCPALLAIAEASGCSSHLVAQDENLFRIAGGGAELWRLNGGEPALIDAEPTCGRSVARDGMTVVFDGLALQATDDGIEILCTFEARTDTCYDGFPSLGVCADSLVLLPRPRSILILRRSDSD